jgi:predicted N-acetyltransferase YhbS
LPGPVDPARLLAWEASPGALAEFSGIIRALPAAANPP